jgi:mono/diheme cytochrome c family protein
MWGTRRIGPDLSREGGVRSADWQYAHLYSPRALVPDTVMPAYPWLFDGAVNRPRQDARDLVAYLESLGRPRELAGAEGEARAREGCNCPADHMMQMAFDGPLNAHPARTRRDAGDVPTLPPGGDLARGQQLYGRLCASCHGASGLGDGPGARLLSPMPTNLAEHAYSTERLAEVLWTGVAGTAMPAWRDYPLADLAAIARAVQALSAERPEPELPEHLMPLGAAAYSANCVQCHGDDGDGRGSAADSLPMAPTNFARQRASLPQALRAVREGIPGSPMAPWTTRLSNAEVVAVAHYVRSLYSVPETRERAR